MPSSARPLLIVSSVETIFATRAGLRYAAQVTIWPIRTRLVSAASAESDRVPRVRTCYRSLARGSGARDYPPRVFLAEDERVLDLGARDRWIPGERHAGFDDGRVVRFRNPFPAAVGDCAALVVELPL